MKTIAKALGLELDEVVWASSQQSRSTRAPLPPSLSTMAQRAPQLPRRRSVV